MATGSAGTRGSEGSRRERANLHQYHRKRKEEARASRSCGSSWREREREDTKIRVQIRLCNFSVSLLAARDLSLFFSCFSFSFLQISQNSIIRVWLACFLSFFLGPSYVSICFASWTILPLGFSPIYVRQRGVYSPKGRLPLLHVTPAVQKRILNRIGKKGK